MIKYVIKIVSVASVLSVCSCVKYQDHKITVEEYRSLEITKADPLAYALAGEKYNRRQTFNYNKYKRIAENQNRQVDVALINPLPLALINDRYGYSAEVFPLYKLYRKGQFEEALMYNGYIHSRDIRDSLGQNDNALFNKMGYRGQQESSQILLDTGHLKSASKVVLPILDNISTENNNQKFEEIQALNNRIIAEALLGNPAFENDAMRVVQFQQEEREKYAKALRTLQEVDKNKPEEYREHRRTKNQVRSLFKTKGYYRALRLSKTVKSPYVNSTADFLRAYAQEKHYLNRLQEDESADWSLVQLQLKNVARNIYNPTAFKDILASVKQEPNHLYHVVYVLVATDIAPSKKILYTKVPMGDDYSSIAFSFLNLSPNPHSVNNVYINNKKIYKIASPEAYMSKDFIDHYDHNLTKQIAMSIGTYIASQMAGSIFESEGDDDGGIGLGMIVNKTVSAVGDRIALPQTEEWQTMPANVYATRIVLPKGKNSISLNVGGKNHTIEINKNFASLVYIRAGGNTVSIDTSE